MVTTRGSRGPWEPRPRGLVLVEAKAHSKESFARASTSSGGHQETVINEILGAHSNIFTPGAKYDPAIYQLLNRFAFGLKLADLGFEVELVFLGFLGASEMDKPFDSHDAWEKHIHSKSEHAIRGSVWTSGPYNVGPSGTFRARIRSTTVPL